MWIPRSAYIFSNLLDVGVILLFLQTDRVDLLLMHKVQSLSSALLLLFVFICNTNLRSTTSCNIECSVQGAGLIRELSPTTS